MNFSSGLPCHLPVCPPLGTGEYSFTTVCAAGTSLPSLPEVLFQLAQSTIPRRTDSLDLDFNVSGTDSKEGVETCKCQETCKLKQL